MMRPRVCDSLIIGEADDAGQVPVKDTVTGETTLLPAFEGWLLRRCDGTRSVPEICAQLARESGLDILPEAVWETLDSFDERGYLATRPAPRAGANYPVGRRGVLAGLGLAPVAALAASVAPARAQTGPADEQQQKRQEEAESKQQSEVQAKQQAELDSKEQAGKDQEQEQKTGGEQTQKEMEKQAEIGFKEQQAKSGETSPKEGGIKEGDTKATAPIPEPVSLTLLGAGLGSLALARLLQRRGEIEQDEKRRARED